MFSIQPILKCNLKIHFGNQKSKKMGLFLDWGGWGCDNICHCSLLPPHWSPALIWMIWLAKLLSLVSPTTAFQDRRIAGTPSSSVPPVNLQTSSQSQWAFLSSAKGMWHLPCGSCSEASWLYLFKSQQSILLETILFLFDFIPFQLMCESCMCVWMCALSHLQEKPVLLDNKSSLQPLRVAFPFPFLSLRPRG